MAQGGSPTPEEFDKSAVYCFTARSLPPCVPESRVSSKRLLAIRHYTVRD